MIFLPGRAHGRAAGRAACVLACVLAIVSAGVGAKTLTRAALDSDGDGVNDVDDNCLLLANPDQLDTDGDDYGNRCDADLDNDLTTNFADLALFKAVFLENGQLAADFNGDGLVNFGDLAFMKSVFLQPPGPSGIVSGPVDLQVVRRFPNLSFSSPTALMQAPGDSSYWYVVRQRGLVKRFADVDSTTATTTFIDLQSQVAYGGEAGLLGMAFHPDFANNGRVFLSYTSSGSPLVSKISRFESPDGGQTLDPASEVSILTLNQPYSNHNGGNIAFGPDGYLYAGFGDGGSFGDPANNAQNTNTLLGSMVRINVDVTEADWDNGVRYYIPSDNPFAGNTGCAATTGCPEIFAWGLRNPWRWSFDAMTGDLWVGDVGQDDREEISLVVNGGNYGWRCYEATLVYNLSNCGQQADYTFPVHSYSHSSGTSVAGGYVYRGNQYPQLYGLYLFADIGGGRIWGLTPDGTQLPGPLIDLTWTVSSFAQSDDRELFLLNYTNGGIYQIQSP